MLHIKGYGGDVRIVYPPAHSTDLNPVEMVWKEPKKYIASDTYRRMDGRTGAADYMIRDGDDARPVGLRARCHRAGTVRGLRQSRTAAAPTPAHLYGCAVGVINPARGRASEWCALRVFGIVAVSCPDSPRVDVIQTRSCPRTATGAIRSFQILVTSTIASNRVSGGGSSRSCPTVGWCRRGAGGRAGGNTSPSFHP